MFKIAPLPFRHRPQHIRNGQGVEALRDELCPFFTPSLLVNCCIVDGSLLVTSDCFGESTVD